jgi:hypothetical protein
LQAAPKSWFRAVVENGLRRGKPWWLPMIGGHRLVAKGVGERAEQPEGLYLGCGLRYSRRKRGLRWLSWSRGGDRGCTGELAKFSNSSVAPETLGSVR